MKNMRKVLFLMLFLLVLGAASISAQVRIGGDEVPNEAAVLDLNADGTTTGTKGLALPRVSLSSDDVILPGVTKNLDGMLVYNTSGSLPAGVYFWNGSNWIMGITDTIPSGGLTKTADGKIGVKAGGITNSMLADASITVSKTAFYYTILGSWGTNGMPANGTITDYSSPAECTGRYAWAGSYGLGTTAISMYGPTVRMYVISRTGGPGGIMLYCW